MRVAFRVHFWIVFGGFVQEVIREKGAFRRCRETGALFFAAVAVVEVEDVLGQITLRGEAH